MADVTKLLEAIDQGEPQAAGALLPLVYDELRKLARQRLRHEQPGQTLQATALVHEAYLRLVANGESRVGSSKNENWHSRGHFFAAAAEAMRRILIEQVRRKHALKAGGNCQRREWDEVAEISVDSATDRLDLLALDEALQKLELQNPRKAELVKLRYFAGLTIEEAAEALGVAASTASADWVYAKSWLCLEMRAAE